MPLIVAGWLIVMGMLSVCRLLNVCPMVVCECPLFEALASLAAAFAAELREPGAYAISDVGDASSREPS